MTFKSGAWSSGCLSINLSYQFTLLISYRRYNISNKQVLQYSLNLNFFPISLRRALTSAEGWEPSSKPSPLALRA